jgi:lambda family phage tail tape measure protein
MANIARLGVALGLNSAEFVSGIEAAGKKLEQFANKAATYGKVGATAFLALTTAAMAYADEIADVAKGNDVAIDSVIKLQNALANSGGSAESAGKLLSSFTKFVDDAAGGSFEAQQKLEKMGLSLKDIGNLSTDTLFQKTIKGLAAIEDPLTRSAKGMEAFGKAGKGVDWVGVAEGMANGAEASKKQAEAVEAAAAAFDTLKQMGRDFNLMLVESLGPSLKLTLEYIKDLKGESNFLGAAFKIVFQTIVVLGSDLQFIFKGISDEISHTIENIKILTTEGIKAAAAANEAYDKRRQQARADLDLFQARIMGTDQYQGKGFDDPRIVKPETGGGRTVKPGVDTEAKKYADMLRQKGFELDKAQLASEFSIANRFLNEQQKIETEYKRKTAEADLERKHRDAAEENKFASKNWTILQEKLFVITQEYEEKKKSLAIRNMVEEAKLQIDMAEESAKAYSALNEFYSQGNTAIREKQDLENTTLDRAQEMFKLEQKGRHLKAEDLQQEKEILQQIWKWTDAVSAINAMQNLDSLSRAEALAREEQFHKKALENIVERGRILKEQKSGTFQEGFMSKMNTFGSDMETSFETGRKAFDSLMGGMTKALDDFVTTGKLNFADFAKAIIKDMLAIQLRAAATNLFSMLAKEIFSPSISLAGSFAGPRADGGPVQNNSTYLVGERGPELFVPRSSGSIVPNHMLGGSQQAPTINYNGPYIASMSAIDTQSGLQFLAKNKQSVWSAYQSANRSIPMSR